MEVAPPKINFHTHTGTICMQYISKNSVQLVVSVEKIFEWSNKKFQGSNSSLISDDNASGTKTLSRPCFNVNTKLI